MSLLLVGLCAFFVVGILVFTRRDYQTGIRVSKILASLCFILAGLLYLPLDTIFGQLMLIGLVFGAIGDVFLLSSQQKLFIRGIAAFLIGHLVYSSAFLVHGLSWMTVVFGIIVLQFVTGILLVKFLPHIPKKLRLPASAYAVAISSMVILAAGTAVASQNMWFIIGALAFYVSDISVSRQHFLKPQFTNKLWGLPLYYGAQLIFAILT